MTSRNVSISRSGRVRSWTVERATNISTSGSALATAAIATLARIRLILRFSPRAAITSLTRALFKRTTATLPTLERPTISSPRNERTPRGFDEATSTPANDCRSDEARPRGATRQAVGVEGSVSFRIGGGATAVPAPVEHQVLEAGFLTQQVVRRAGVLDDGYGTRSLVHGAADAVASDRGKHVESLFIATWKRTYADGDFQRSVLSCAWLARSVPYRLNGDQAADFQ